MRYFSFAICRLKGRRAHVRIVHPAAMENLQENERQAVLDLTDEQVDSIVHGKAPRLPYRRLVYDPERRVVAHFGQVKLGLGLIRFLRQYGHLSRTVVYAGAAPGTNITQVARMFTSHHFFLYDPSPFRLFDEGVLDYNQEPVSERLHPIQDFFTDEVAEGWADDAQREGILFISDIRTAESGDIPMDDDILRDLEMQHKWYRILGNTAKASMLKFRLPFEVPPHEVQYPQGQIWLQPWAPPSSTETRLVLLPDAQTITYETRCYEEELFYHNIVRREWYKCRQCNCRTLSSIMPGFDGCYDCSLALKIFEQGASDRNLAPNMLATFLRQLRVDLRTHEGHSHEILNKRKRELTAARRRSEAAAAAALQ